MAPSSDVSYLIETADALGIAVSEEQAGRLLDFLDMMLAKNEVINLTAIRDHEKGLVLHLLDSLLFMKGMEATATEGSYVPASFGTPVSPTASFVDMGCGAGFPGIPLALVNPGLHGVLCDSVKKKIAAVDEFIEALDLKDRLSTSTERLEALPLQTKARFDCAFARALAPLPALIEYAAPLLKKGGRLIVSKGTPERDELEAGQRAAKVAGMRRIQAMELELPDGYGHRTILIYGKIAMPSVRLPRPVGYALRHPLA